MTDFLLNCLRRGARRLTSVGPVGGWVSPVRAFTSPSAAYSSRSLRNEIPTYAEATQADDLGRPIPSSGPRFSSLDRRAPQDPWGASIRTDFFAGVQGPDESRHHYEAPRDDLSAGGGDEKPEQSHPVGSDAEGDVLTPAGAYGGKIENSGMVEAVAPETAEEATLFPTVPNSDVQASARQRTLPTTIIEASPAFPRQASLERAIANEEPPNAPSIAETSGPTRSVEPIARIEPVSANQSADGADLADSTPTVGQMTAQAGSLAQRQVEEGRSSMPSNPLPRALHSFSLHSQESGYQQGSGAAVSDTSAAQPLLDVRAEGVVGHNSNSDQAPRAPRSPSFSGSRRDLRPGRSSAPPEAVLPRIANDTRPHAELGSSRLDDTVSTLSAKREISPAFKAIPRLQAQGESHMPRDYGGAPEQKSAPALTINRLEVRIINRAPETRTEPAPRPQQSSIRQPDWREGLERHYPGRLDLDF